MLDICCSVLEMDSMDSRSLTRISANALGANATVVNVRF